MIKKTKNIVLLHGWGSNIKKLEPLSQQLSNLGWNVFIPKLPYFDAPEPNNPWNVFNFSDFVKKKSEKHFNDQPYYIFGHSNGGRISIKIASQKIPLLQGIILCSSAGISRDNVCKRLFFNTINLLFSPFKKTSFYPKVRKLIYKIARNYDYYKITSPNKKETFRLIIAENLKKDAQKISIPTLILWGEKDRITPLKDALWLNKNIPGSKIKIYINQSHTLPYFESKDIAKEIDSWT